MTTIGFLQQRHVLTSIDSTFAIQMNECTMDVNTDIRERIAIKNFIASSAEHMRIIKLFVDNFKHVKWHTAFDFWNELAIELERNGASIAEQPTPDDITNTTHYDSYKKSYKTLNDYGIQFSIHEFNLFIQNSSEDCIYWGMEKKFLTPKQMEQIIQFNEIEKDYFDIDQKEISRYFTLAESESIILSDFSYAGIFNLINETYRSNIIQKKLVPEILTFLNKIA